MTNTPHSKSQAIPLVKREDVKFFISLFSEFDDDFYPLLRQAQIPNDIFNPNIPYDFLPETTLKNLITVLGSRMLIEDFGQLITKACREVYIPRFTSQLTDRTSLHEALNQFSLILRSASSSARIYPKKAGGKWWLIRDKTEVNEIWFKYGEIFSVIFLCELLRSLTNGKWIPKEIGIQSEHDNEFTRLPRLSKAQFYCSRPTTALYIPEDIIQTSIVIPNAIVTKASSPIVCDTFLDSFKLAITPYVSMGKLPIKLASEILNINVRTIQRRLKEHNAIYSQVIEEMVFNQITQLLKCDQLLITEVANKMGYSDSAHFTRAFKRLMHMTPREYRSKFKNKTR